MNVEVLAVGTELLLGAVVDTNSAWIGEQLALRGINLFRTVAVGDNHKRIVDAMQDALARADAVIVTGGLGPTDDDITRQAATHVMGDELVYDESLAVGIRNIFDKIGRPMAESNLRQAWRPSCATPIAQTGGTAPGLICPVGNKVMYLVPGVPREMEEMLTNVVLDDLVRRRGSNGVIATRIVRTWGVSEARIGELVADRVREIDETGAQVRIAFLARGIEGVHVRLTVKSDHLDDATRLLDKEEALSRSLLGDCVYGIDDQTMEFAVGELLQARGLTLGVAESMTGGLIASRVTDTKGSSKWFKGGVVSYASEVKFGLLGVTPGEVVTFSCAGEMAAGVCKAVESDIGISVTGVAGPARQENKPPGTVFCGIAGLRLIGFEDDVEVLELSLAGDRERIRNSAAMNLLNTLRLRLAGTLSAVNS